MPSLSCPLLVSYDHMTMLPSWHWLKPSVIHILFGSLLNTYRKTNCLAAVERPGNDQLEHVKTILEGDIFGAKC